MANILVTGGAGYIGSHMAEMLYQEGHNVIVYDNLLTGHKKLVLNAKLIVADLADAFSLEECFTRFKFDAVMHFASSIDVAESIQKPAKYYRNNVVNGINLLDIMLKHGVKKLVFSSSAAVYGEAKMQPQPLSPYGYSKLIFERLLQDYDYAYGLKSIAFRYFNAAGADPDGRLGELHNPEIHLIPLVLQVASGRKANISIYGNDYPTSDGTCVRDYVHVVDLCKAHLLAFDALNNGAKSQAYDLGCGSGYSVLEVIKCARQVTAKEIPIIVQSRREGDPATLVADTTAAKKELGWQPQFSNLLTIIEHAWNWEQTINALQLL